MLIRNIYRVFFFLLIPIYVCAQDVHKLTGYQGIKGSVLDAETGKPLSARIEIRDTTGRLQSTYYHQLDGIFTAEDGTFSLPLRPGKYTMKIIHGIDFLTKKIDFAISEKEGASAIIRLDPWVKLKQRGWLNGDGHAHLYSDIKMNDTMTKQVRRLCLAQGVDFISACQGWAGYNDDNWRSEYGKVSDEKFQLFYGAEMPKYRSGHVWWLGLASTRGYFEHLMDTAYENQYYQAPIHTNWDFSWLKFSFIPDIEVISRYSKYEKAHAVIAHPTSWWMQPRENITKYTTNITGNLSFGLLSGNVWNGMTVMGYMADNYFYQNIWFHLLNEGYIMPPFSELDGGYPADNKFYYGYLRTYYLTDPAIADPLTRITDAVQKGHTFVTSGPIILADIDKKYNVGDIIPLDKSTRKLHIEAYASGETSDYLSYVIVFRNGKIYHSWDLRDKKPRTLKQEISLSEKDDAWYVVKVYGKDAWQQPENIDVMAYCQNLENAPEKKGLDGAAPAVAITSPFYFRHAGVTSPQPLISEVNLEVTDPNTNDRINEGKVSIFLAGEKIDSFQLHNGIAHFTMPVNSLITITNGNKTITRGLYLDYPPYLAILERIANGNWRDDHNWINTLVPGHVPWSVFAYDETSKLLRNVKWKIKFEDNERDDLWKDFDALFNK
ncbi:hypothetical protein ACDQ55_21120 [Chitinophaga sp. 30R24]|uniref:hypothetical protein n=1 Tax=Chitinophaga sp. 30R24 TaxID=3248838 RepID=UPI003B9017D5